MQNYNYHWTVIWAQSPHLIQYLSFLVIEVLQSTYWIYEAWDWNPNASSIYAEHQHDLCTLLYHNCLLLLDWEFCHNTFARTLFAKNFVIHLFYTQQLSTRTMPNWAKTIMPDIMNCADKNLIFEKKKTLFSFFTPFLQKMTVDTLPQDLYHIHYPTLNHLSDAFNNHRTLLW